MNLGEGVPLREAVEVQYLTRRKVTQPNPKIQIEIRIFKNEDRTRVRWSVNACAGRACVDLRAAHSPVYSQLTPFSMASCT